MRRIRKTSLHRIIREGNAKVIPVLIEAVADVHAKDDDGKTPLDWAKSQGCDDPDVTKLLSGAVHGNSDPASDSC